MGVRGNATLRSRHYGAIFNGGDASASSFFFCLFFFLHKKSGGSHPQSLEEWTCVAVANRNQRKKRFLQIHGSESETSIPRVKYITEKRKKQKKICIHRKTNAKCPLLSFSLFCLQQKTPPEGGFLPARRRKISLPQRRCRYFLRPLCSLRGNGAGLRLSAPPLLDGGRTETGDRCEV